MKYSLSSFGDFKCAHCGAIVSSAHFLSGVNNRNHCPYCLWSCHLDLYTAGDRLCACKGQMKPVGLTMKKGRNKYRLENGGELMLVHECVNCGTLSINRIASDDDSSAIVEIFESSFGSTIHARCEQHNIVALKQCDMDLLYKRLFGGVEQPVAAW
jgi:DNA-directed RNA polymerase subunit RPC12/RpoP